MLRTFVRQLRRHGNVAVAPGGDEGDRSDSSSVETSNSAPRSAVQRALRRPQRQQERFRTLTRLSSDWFWEQDSECRFVQITEGARSTGGIPREAHVGKTRWELPAIWTSTVLFFG